MVRHLSIGTATIVALMAAHRAARDQWQASRGLDEYFRQEAARIDDYLRALDQSNKRGERTARDEPHASRVR
jgi:hypothetical protein